MRKFNPHSKQAERALQAWIILVGHAMRQETTTYQDLSIKMFGHDCRGVLSQILGCVHHYCTVNRLPHLNVIAINKASGEPGRLIPMGREEIAPQTVAVFAFDWYDLYPPTVAELQESDCPSAGK